MRLVVCLAMMVRVAQYLAQSPFIWESCHWANATELAFVAVLLLCPLDAVVRESQHLIRTMMGFFYVGAGFWKMNSSFLDPTVSCGSVYVASLLATFVPAPLRPEWLVTPALRSAGWMTVFGECGLGVCLLMRSRGLNRLGFVLSNMLHYAICITPFPNAVPLFGVFCYTRLFLVLPHGWTVALQEATSAPASFVGVVARVFCLGLAAMSASCTSTPGVVIDWGIPTQTLLCCIGARAVWLDIKWSDRWNGTNGPGSGKSPTPTSAPVAGWRRLLLRLNSTVWILITCFYVFCAQALGVFSISATSPFSQIREHGGSNHLFMPTGLLQRWEATKHYDLFSGGVVRVTYTSSDVMNALYPANSTQDLRPEIAQMLRSHGHFALEFHPTVMRMFGPKLASILPHWKPTGSAPPFPVYTVPGLELRRLLGEARAARETFVLEYDVLPGLSGDETWRREAVERRVRLEEDGKGGRICTVRNARVAPDEDEASMPCTPSEIPMRPAPAGLLMKFLVWFPLPVLPPEIAELPCID